MPDVGKASHSHAGLKKLMLGIIAPEALHDSHVPVLWIRPWIQRIVMGCDYAGPALAVIRGSISGAWVRTVTRAAAPF